MPDADGELNLFFQDYMEHDRRLVVQTTGLFLLGERA